MVGLASASASALLSRKFVDVGSEGRTGSEHMTETLTLEMSCRLALLYVLQCYDIEVSAA